MFGKIETLRGSSTHEVASTVETEEVSPATEIVSVDVD